MIEVTLLGTGSPIPDARRAGPSTLVRAGGQTFLIDCGRGVQQRITAAGVGANALSALLLTHLHSDHIADLGDLLITRWVTTFDPNPLPLPIIRSRTAIQSGSEVRGSWAASRIWKAFSISFELPPSKAACAHFSPGAAYHFCTIRWQAVVHCAEVSNSWKA